MRFTSIILALAATIVAAPASPAQELHTLLAQSEQCQLPEPKPNCAGAATKDVIVQYGKNFTQEQRDLFLNAAKSAGSDIQHEWKTFGFAGFVPESTISLIKAHGSTLNLKVYDNACTEIPWCGEAPC